MKYTYVNQKNIKLEAELLDNEIIIKTTKKEIHEIKKYKYNEIKTINLSVIEINWYGITIVFNHGFKVHLKSISFGKATIGSSIGHHSQDYIDFVDGLHTKILNKKLENSIKFTQGNPLIFVLLSLLMIFIAFFLVPMAIEMGKKLIFFTFIIPASIFVISYMKRLGFIKKYKPNELPEKYLPKV